MSDCHYSYSLIHWSLIVHFHPFSPRMLWSGTLPSSQSEPPVIFFVFFFSHGFLRIRWGKALRCRRRFSTPRVFHHGVPWLPWPNTSLIVIISGLPESQIHDVQLWCRSQTGSRHFWSSIQVVHGHYSSSGRLPLQPGLRHRFSVVAVSQFHMHPVPTHCKDMWFAAFLNLVHRSESFWKVQWVRLWVGTWMTWQFSTAAGADQHGLGVCFPGDQEGGNLALDHPWCKYTLQIATVLVKNKSFLLSPCFSHFFIQHLWISFHFRLEVLVDLHHAGAFRSTRQRMHLCCNKDLTKEA